MLLLVGVGRSQRLCEMLEIVVVVFAVGSEKFVLWIVLMDVAQELFVFDAVGSDLLDRGLDGLVNGLLYLHKVKVVVDNKKYRRMTNFQVDGIIAME